MREEKQHSDSTRDREPPASSECIALADLRICAEIQPVAAPSRRAFWTMTVVFLLGMAGGTLPSPLYPFYQDAFGFSNTVVTVIFSAYGIGVLFTLVVLGRLSDRVGRRPMLLVALGLAAVSTLVFLLADGVAFLVAGRLLSGLAVGVLSGTATATLVELEPSGSRRRASVVGGIVTPGGLALGTLLTGTVIQFGPLPFRLVFIVYLGLLAVLAGGVASLPETVVLRPPGRGFQIQRLHVPKGIWASFVVAAVGVFATFAMMSTFAALVPSFLVQALAEPGPLISGGALAVLFGAASIAPPLIGRGSIGRAGTVGLGAVILGLSLFLAGLFWNTLIPLVAGCAVAGFGGGCFFVGTLAMINRDAPPNRRAEVVSAYFVAGYLGVTLPPVGVGISSTRIGIVPSVLAMSGVIVILAGMTQVGMHRSAV